MVYPENVNEIKVNEINVNEINVNEIKVNEIKVNEIKVNEINVKPPQKKNKQKKQKKEKEEEQLNTTWLENFKEAENIYVDFYKEPVDTIKLFYIYVNREKEIEHIHTDIYSFLEKGWLKRDAIIHLIKQNEMLYALKYKLASLLRYNIDLNPNEIKDYLNNDNREDNVNRFITSEKYLNDILFADTINMFQDLNALFFIYREEAAVAAAATTSLATTTKRIIMHQRSHQRKTKRKLQKKY